MLARKVLFLIPLLAISAGCVTAPPPQTVPEFDRSAVYQLGRHEALDMTAHTQGHLDDEREVIYFQTQGGGGAGLGLALGPLGVAANAKMIKDMTEKDLERFTGAIVADVDAPFAEAALAESLDIVEGAAVYVELSPYFLVTRVDDTDIRFAAALLVSTDSAGVEWTGKYISELPVVKTLDEAAAGLDFESRQELRAMLVDGFRDAIDLYRSDAAGTLGAGVETKFRSKLLSPRFDFELTALRLPAHAEGRELFRLPAGMFSLQADLTEIQ